MWNVQFTCMYINCYISIASLELMISVWKGSVKKVPPGTFWISYRFPVGAWSEIVRSSASRNPSYNKSP